MPRSLEEGSALSGDGAKLSIFGGEFLSGRLVGRGGIFGGFALAWFGEREGRGGIGGGALVAMAVSRNLCSIIS